MDIMYSWIRNISAFVLMLLFFNVADAAEKIIVERYENWRHPVLEVLKKYGITLNKVTYSVDGIYPTFYAKFKYSPDPRAPDADGFHKVYFEVLKANFYHPYALVDEEDDMRIDVGWEDKKGRIMKVGISKLNSVSSCTDSK
jgi:hypothetical protein